MFARGGKGRLDGKVQGAEGNMRLLRRAAMILGVHGVWSAGVKGREGELDTRVWVHGFGSLIP